MHGNSNISSSSKSRLIPTLRGQEVAITIPRGKHVSERQDTMEQKEKDEILLQSGSSTALGKPIESNKLKIGFRKGHRLTEVTSLI